MQAFMSVYSLLNRHSNLNLQSKIIIYLQLIRPVMLYGSPVWAATAKTNRKVLQTLQNKIIRTIFGAPWFIRNQILQNDAKINSIDEEILKTVFKFYEKMSNHPSSVIQNIGNYDYLVNQKYKRPRTIHHNELW
ncbi:putative RNA-directed DNA polymerase from transposon BS, partial [Stegodyphus mimosarum]